MSSRCRLLTVKGVFGHFALNLREGAFQDVNEGTRLDRWWCRLVADQQLATRAAETKLSFMSAGCPGCSPSEPRGYVHDVVALITSLRELDR